MKKLHNLLLIICVFPIVALAQSVVADLPRVSQKATVSQTIGMTDITIIYHRPAVDGREVWGKLVPYNAPWRAGANDNTVVSFTDEVMVEGKPLAAGTYGLHMIPTEGEWTIIFSNNSTAWGSFYYNPQEDALRVKVEPQSHAHEELLTYTFDNVTGNEATFSLMWEKKKVPVKIAVDLEKTVVPKLRAQLQHRPSWTWLGWNEAAQYCLDNKINIDEAEQWAHRSVFINANGTNIITEARLTALKNDGEEKPEKVVAELENVLERNPVTWKEWNAAAKYAYQQKQYDRALAFSDKSVAEAKMMNNLQVRADILRAQGKEKAAEKILKEGMAVASNGELNQYGYNLLFSGRTAEAVAIFEANAKKHPDDPNCWDSLGEGYYQNGQKDKAIESLKKSLSMHPPDNIRANSIRLLSEMGVQYDGSGTN